MTLSDRDRKRLEGVNPRLVAVIQRAAQITTVPFMVVEGVRTDEQAYANYGKGRTVAELQAAGVPNAHRYAAPKLAKVTWLRNPLASKHLKQADGYGHAVDLLPAPYDWKATGPFDAMADAVLHAADELDENVRWGADWDGDGKRRERGETDSPHFEI